MRKFSRGFYYLYLLVYPAYVLSRGPKISSHQNRVVKYIELLEFAAVRIFPQVLDSAKHFCGKINSAQNQ